MTDIAELIKRLHENAETKSGQAWGRMDGGQDLCLAANLAEEAAAALERAYAEPTPDEVKCAQKHWEYAAGPAHNAMAAALRSFLDRRRTSP